MKIAGYSAAMCVDLGEPIHFIVTPRFCVIQCPPFGNVFDISMPTAYHHIKSVVNALDVTTAAAANYYCQLNNFVKIVVLRPLKNDASDFALQCSASVRVPHSLFAPARPTTLVVRIACTMSLDMYYRYVHKDQI